MHLPANITDEYLKFEKINLPVASHGASWNHHFLIVASCGELDSERLKTVALLRCVGHLLALPKDNLAFEQLPLKSVWGIFPPPLLAIQESTKVTNTRGHEKVKLIPVGAQLIEAPFSAGSSYQPPLFG